MDPLTSLPLDISKVKKRNDFPYKNCEPCIASQAPNTRHVNIEKHVLFL